MNNQEYFARIMRIGGKMIDSGLHFNYVMNIIYTGCKYNSVLYLLIKWDEEKEEKYRDFILYEIKELVNECNRYGGG